MRKRNPRISALIVRFILIGAAALIAAACASPVGGTETGGKSAGAAVGAPVLEEKSHNSIIVSPPPAAPKGQTIEYVKNTENSVPAAGWQDSVTFSGLTAETKYYIFARSKENGSYNAGAASTPLEETTNKEPSDPSNDTSFRPPETPGFIKNCAKHLPYMDKASGENMVIDMKGGTIIGTDAILWIQKPFTSSTILTQVFKFIPDVKEEYFQIQSSYNTQYVIVLSGDIASEGMGLKAAYSNTADNSQWWKLLRQPDGSFAITNKTNPALVVAALSELPSGSSHNILTMQPLGAANSTWTFEPLP
ncbi:RICIN domain-containing protein [Breznakiella homolactica]|uniref:RICIN domain-containing protein n=1 Tax=Breznakiella homolactica TaxID=2798577 RepID=A0A7T8B900_9SPIR|nr:RICIN domain-containing protein [Breznakiella homolactica]QQO07836.1 RICIN domain-containing protein [Breznakiella homolactica]